MTDELVEQVAAVLLGRVNAPEQEIYRTARAVIPVVLEEAAKVASLYIIEGNSIHPDIPAEKIGEQQKMIAHTTCQHVAEAIRQLGSI